MSIPPTADGTFIWLQSARETLRELERAQALPGSRTDSLANQAASYGRLFVQSLERLQTHLEGVESNLPIR